MESFTGGMSRTSAMPCVSYNLPASVCQRGARLACVPGTACHKCYARKGRYGFPNVRNALARRFVCVSWALQSAEYREGWIQEMVRDIRKDGTGYMRWHDSGDLQSREHFELIAEVARRTPEVRHWLPTKELRYVPREYPPNLTVRYSLPMIDGQIPATHRLPLATIHTDKVAEGAFECRKPAQGGQCLDCRVCWNAGVRVVSYKLH